MIPPLRIAPGTVIDGFTVGEILHSGGMALIYHASHPDAGMPLVMKVPRFGHGEPGTSVVSHEIERQMLETLKGPHVPRLIRAGELERLPYLAMEFIEGHTIEHWVAKAPVAPGEVARLGAAVATAVHSLHLQEAIHLDVKPGNVIVRPSGEAVLIDFGLAHHAEFPDLLAEEFRRPIGSAPYIAPEQVFSVRCDPRSDVFAIGVMLYELATGKLPYGSPTSPRGLRKRCYRDPVPPRALVPGIPEWLQEVTLRCLEPDARRRYASAAQLAFDLAHPEHVTVGERGRRLAPSGFKTRIVRWVRMAGYEPAPCPPPSTHISSTSIVLVAIAPGGEGETSARALADMTRRTVGAPGEFRVVCATVIRPLPQWGTSDPDQTPAREHLRHLVQLKQWAKALDIPEERLSFHVLESNDPAGAILDYVRTNNVDHIIIGAPVIAAGDGRSGPVRRGSIGTRIMTEATCHVTVVKSKLLEARHG